MGLQTHGQRDPKKKREEEKVGEKEKNEVAANFFHEESEKRRRESRKEGKSGVLSCRVILCDKLRCQLVSDGQKTLVFCHDRIEVIPLRILLGGSHTHIYIYIYSISEQNLLRAKGCYPSRQDVLIKKQKKKKQVDKMYIREE